MEVKKGQFSLIMRALTPLYEEYKETNSYQELKRRMEEAERVTYNLYLEGEKDVFSGKIDEDGTLKLREGDNFFKNGVVYWTIKENGTYVSKLKPNKKRKSFIEKVKDFVKVNNSGRPTEDYKEIESDQEVYLSFE